MKIFAATATTFVSALVPPASAAPNFTKVGSGGCSDALGKPYYSLVISNSFPHPYLYMTSLTGGLLTEACKAWCATNDYPQLVGLSTVDKYCHCLFSGGLPPSLTLSSYSNPNADKLFNSSIGNGPVVGLIGWSQYLCYRNENFVTTTTSPTISPVTANPTKSPVTSLPTRLPSKMPSLEPSHSFQGVKGKSIPTPNCSIAGNVPQLTCFTTMNAADIFPGAVLFIRLAEGACQVGDEATTEGSLATIGMDLNQDCKNAGSCTSTSCLRIDVKSQGVSILASMYDVVSVLEYSKEGLFSATVQTAEFKANGESITTIATTSLSASLGVCGSTYEVDSPLKVGSIASICISSDDDIKLLLKFVVANPGNQVLVDNGVANFLTTLQENKNYVTLSTLMVPIFYDLQSGDAGRITVNGTASIIYSRRLENGHSLEETEESLFLIEIPLASGTRVPDISQVQVDKTNAGPVLGFKSVTGVVLAMVIVLYF